MLYTDMRLWYLSYQLNAIVLYIRINICVVVHQLKIVLLYLILANTVTLLNVALVIVVNVALKCSNMDGDYHSTCWRVSLILWASSIII